MFHKLSWQLCLGSNNQLLLKWNSLIMTFKYYGVVSVKAAELVVLPTEACVTLAISGILFGMQK